jgi:hypothetical protein
MKCEWFRDQWKGNKGDMTPFVKGASIAGGRQFPLTRGIMQTHIKELDREKVSDYIYSVKGD